MRKSKLITVACEACGTEMKRYSYQILEHVFCSRKCSKGYLSLKMTNLNGGLNPDRMNLETRTKLRKARLGTGKGESYAKTFGKHSHMIAAEKMIGRSLLKGEVVHHINNNKRDNHPLNLMVFQSQSKHAEWHKNEQYDGSKNFE